MMLRDEMLQHLEVSRPSDSTSRLYGLLFANIVRFMVNVFGPLNTHGHFLAH
jgi:hypothetical protein